MKGPGGAHTVVPALTTSAQVTCTCQDVTVGAHVYAPGCAVLSISYVKGGGKGRFQSIDLEKEPKEATIC